MNSPGQGFHRGARYLQVKTASMLRSSSSAWAEASRMHVRQGRTCARNVADTREEVDDTLYVTHNTQPSRISMRIYTAYLQIFSCATTRAADCRATPAHPKVPSPAPLQRTTRSCPCGSLSLGCHRENDEVACSREPRAGAACPRGFRHRGSDVCGDVI